MYFNYKIAFVEHVKLISLGLTFALIVLLQKNQYSHQLSTKSVPKELRLTISK
jgi:hypothetical protein